MLASASCSEALALLVREDGGSAPERWPLILVLHDRGQDAAAAVALARELAGPEPGVLAPQAARPCNPMQSNFAGAPAYAGYCWFLGADASHPEPASFGDSLRQLELLIESTHNRCIAVLGQGQGAVLAQALAQYEIPAIAGVAWRDGTLPSLPGWNAAPRRMPDLLELEARDSVRSQAASHSQQLPESHGAVEPRMQAWLRTLMPSPGVSK